MLKRNNIITTHLVAMGAIAIAIAVSYWMSLWHAPRADQLYYILDMYPCHTCTDTLFHSYSANRSRVTIPRACDVLLFRPLFFTYLALIDCTIRNSFMLIQFIGIMLHFMICMMLYEIIYQFGLYFTHAQKKLHDVTLSPNAIAFFAFIVTLTFALSPMNVEQVIWSHIQGYSLSTLIVLVIASQTLSIIYEQTFTLKTCMGLWLLCLLACFFYEANAVLALLVAILLFKSGSKLISKQTLTFITLSFFLIPLIYISIDYYDFIKHHDYIAQVSPLSKEHPFDSFGKIFSLASITNLFRFLRYTIGLPLLSLYPPADFSYRIHIQEITLQPFSIISIATSCAWIMIIGLLFFTPTLLLKQKATHKQGIHLTLFNFLLFGWLSAYVLINVLGRINLRPMRFYGNTYYAYIPFLIACLIIGINGLVITSRYKVAFEKINLKTRTTLVITLLFLFTNYIVARGIFIFNVNQYIAKDQAQLVSITHKINALIAQHPFATFCIPTYAVERLPMISGIPIIQSLYSSRIEPCHATYLITGDSANAVHLQTAAQHNSKQGCEPTFIKPGIKYNYFWYQGTYYGVPHTEGNSQTHYFIPEKMGTYAPLFNPKGNIDAQACNQ